MNQKTWTIGRGIGIGLIAIAISVSIVAGFSFLKHELNIYHYSNCLEINQDMDRCIPIMNDNYYPTRAYEKPIPLPEEKVIESEET